MGHCKNPIHLTIFFEIKAKKVGGRGPYIHGKIRELVRAFGRGISHIF